MNPRHHPSGVLKVGFVPMLARAAKRASATIEISKAVELPSGGILEAAGPGYFVKAPKGTDREATRQAVKGFLRSEKNKGKGRRTP